MCKWLQKSSREAQTELGYSEQYSSRHRLKWQKPYKTNNVGDINSDKRHSHARFRKQGPRLGGNAGYPHAAYCEKKYKAKESGQVRVNCTKMLGLRQTTAPIFGKNAVKTLDGRNPIYQYICVAGTKKQGKKSHLSTGWKTNNYNFA